MSTKPEQAVSYLSFVLEGFCENPVEIAHSVDEWGLFLDLKPQDKDVPYVIGRKGANISSIRNIMRLWGRKNRANVAVIVKGDREKFYENR